MDTSGGQDRTSQHGRAAGYNPTLHPNWTQSRRGQGGKDNTLGHTHANLCYLPKRSPSQRRRRADKTAQASMDVPRDTAQPSNPNQDPRDQRGAARDKAGSTGIATPACAICQSAGLREQPAPGPLLVRACETGA